MIVMCVEESYKLINLFNTQKTLRNLVNFINDTVREPLHFAKNIEIWQFLGRTLWNYQNGMRWIHFLLIYWLLGVTLLTLCLTYILNLMFKMKVFFKLIQKFDLGSKNLKMHPWNHSVKALISTLLHKSINESNEHIRRLQCRSHPTNY